MGRFEVRRPLPHGCAKRRIFDYALIPEVVGVEKEIKEFAVAEEVAGKYFIIMGILTADSYASSVCRKDFLELSFSIPKAESRLRYKSGSESSAVLAATRVLFIVNP